MNKKNPITYANQEVQMQSSHRQKGALLPMTMVILVIVTVLAISSTASTNVTLKIAENQQRQYQAKRAAENAVNFYVAEYPNRSTPTNADFNIFGMSVNPSFRCRSRTEITDSSPTENYTHVDIRVRVSDINSGAEATAVKSIKYRGDGSHPNEEMNVDCGVVGNTPEPGIEDPALLWAGDRKVMYAYYEIENRRITDTD